MARVTAGFGNLRKEQEAQSAGRMNGDFIKYLRLSDDGDMAKIRIVSSHEAGKTSETGIPSYSVNAVFHRHEAWSSNNKRYFTSTICGKEQDKYGNLVGECSLCDQEIPRSLQFMLWVWVYDIYHKTQNPDPKNPWEIGKLGALEMYKEPINQFMIWQDGYYSSQALEGRIAQYGSITDRDYWRIRRGVRGSQQVRYELDRDEPSDIPPEIVEKAKLLPDLMEVAVGNIRTMDGNSPSFQTEGTPLKSSDDPVVAPRYEEVSMDIDEEDLPF